MTENKFKSQNETMVSDISILIQTIKIRINKFKDVSRYQISGQIQFSTLKKVRIHTDRAGLNKP